MNMKQMSKMKWNLVPQACNLSCLEISGGESGLRSEFKASSGKLRRLDLNVKIAKRARDVNLWQNTCLACVKY